MRPEYTAKLYIDGLFIRYGWVKVDIFARIKY